MSDIHSEQDYLAATQKLADEFLREYTHEQLAVIAAQHVIFREHIERENGVLRDLCDMTELKYKNLVQIQTGTIRKALDEYPSYQQRKRAQKLHEPGNAHRIELVRLYDETSKDFSSKTAFCEAAVEQFYKTKRTKFSTYMKWLRDDRPATGSVRKKPDLGFLPRSARKNR